MADWVARINASNGTSFQKKVWGVMARIPKGKVSTYGLVARAIGNPKAVRAVGFACNQNPFAPDVPCHRIVSSDGKLGGYAHGSAKKIALLKSEGIEVRKGRVKGFDSVLFYF
jgi:O-6-methylguanine DNA methyltransferase